MGVDFSSIGKSNVSRGKGFERRCIPLMINLTGHPSWRRTIAGYEQSYGDLIPILRGEHDQSKKLFVECKYRSKISIRILSRLIEEVQEKNILHLPWIVLIGQPNNPTFVCKSEGFITEKGVWDGSRSFGIFSVSSNGSIHGGH